MQLYDNVLSIPRDTLKKFLILTPFIVLLLIAAVGVYFRVHLSLYTDGDYFVGPDSYRHVRHIRQIVSDGALPKVDLMRHVPDGVKATLNAIGFPWVIAQIYNFLNRFLPGLSLNKTMALYPAVVIVFSCIIYFLLINKYFGFLTAFLATLALSTAPTLIDRTTVGYVDADSLILSLFLLAFLFYTLSLDALTTFKQVSYKLICSGILGIIGILWLGVSLIAGIIYGCDFLIGIYRGFNKKQAVASIWGICLYLGLLFLPSRIYQEKLFEPFALSAIIPALLVSFLYIATLIGPNEFQRSKYFNKIFSKKGLIALSLLFAYPVYRLKGIVIPICERLLFPFGTDPIMKFVGELQPMGLSDWWNNYGLLYPIGLVGLFLLVSEHCFRGRKSKNSRFHFILFSLEILCIILTRTFTPFFLRQPLWVNLTVLIIPAGWAILHISYLLLKNGAEKVLPFIVWFLVSFHFNSSAMRFSLLFTPIFVLIGSVCFVKALGYFTPDLRETIGFGSLFALNIIAWLLFVCGSDIFMLIQRAVGASFGISTRIRLLITLGFSLISFGVFIEKSMIHMGARIAIKKFCGFLVICLLCFFAYTGVYGLGIGQVGYIRAKPPISRTEKFVHQVRENTPPDAVVAADWNYGSFINEIGQRATIIDDEQNIDRIRNFNRQVIVGRSVEEMLNFLKAHHATHLVLTTRNLMRLNQHWFEAYPNQPLDSPFVIQLKPLIMENPKVTRFEYVPLAKFVSISHKDSSTVYHIHVSKIVIDFINDEGNITVLTPPQAILEEGDSSKSISIREIIMGSQQWYFPEAELPLTVWLDASINYSQHLLERVEIHNAFLLMPKAYELNAVKLFFNELKEHFEAIVTEDNGYAKVWKVHY